MTLYFLNTYGTKVQQQRLQNQYSLRTGSLARACENALLASLAISALENFTGEPVRRLNQIASDQEIKCI